jgi:hypothetical protein
VSDTIIYECRTFDFLPIVIFRLSCFCLAAYPCPRCNFNAVADKGRTIILFERLPDIRSGDEYIIHMRKIIVQVGSGVIIIGNTRDEDPGRISTQVVGMPPGAFDRSGSEIR